MATYASSWRGCEVGGSVALQASHCLVCSGKRERCPGVIKVRAYRHVEPGRSVMTLLACLRKTGGDVVRVRCFPEIREVTTHARGGRRREVAGGVALRALHRRLGSGERERRLGMIKGCVQPCTAVVAWLARLREAGSRVVRVCGFGKI